MRLIGALALFLLGLSNSLSAQTFTSWQEMHPYLQADTMTAQQSFAPTVVEAAAQARLMGYSDAFAAKLMDQLTAHLDGDTDTLSGCYDATSRDGTRYSKLGYNKPGQLPVIGYRQIQRLGVDLPVIECVIDNITLHWFHSADNYAGYSSIEGACNNLAVLYVPPARTARALAPPAQKPQPAPPPAAESDWGVMNAPGRSVAIGPLTIPPPCGCSCTSSCAGPITLPGVATTTPGWRFAPADGF